MQTAVYSQEDRRLDQRWFSGFERCMEDEFAMPSATDISLDTAGSYVAWPSVKGVFREDCRCWVSC